MPSVSVIVPVYNVENYLPQCIDSIRNQTLRDIEIVCVVDGSTDRSETILRMYEKVEPRMRIICKKNGGLSSARNAGIDASTAPILMFVDSDDAISADACLTVLSAFEAVDAEMVTFGAKCEPFFESNNWYEKVLTPKYAYYPSFSPDILFEENSHPFVWRTAVKKELLDREKLRFDEDRKFGEDEVFHFEAYPKARGVVFLADFLYRYRLSRPNSLMASRLANNLLKCKEHLAIAERILSMWRSYGILEESKKKITEWAAEFVVYNCMIVPNDGWRELHTQIEAIFQEYIEPSWAYEMEYGLPLQELCAALSNGASVETIAELRDIYLTFIRYEGEEGESWLPLPRKIAACAATPVMALGERARFAFDSIRRDGWDAVDAANCMRSLEMLRNEVAAKSK